MLGPVQQSIYLSVDLSEMFKGRVEVLPEDGPDAAPDAVEHRLRLRRKRQSVVEVPGGRYYKLNYACELVSSAN